MKLINRALSLLLVLCMAVSPLTTWAAAQEPADRGAAAQGVAAPRSDDPYTWLDNDRKIEYPAAKTSAVADSTQSGYGAEKMLDGDVETTWQASWSSPPATPTITLTLSDAEYVTGFLYESRQDNNISGIMTDYSVYVSTDGAAYSTEPAATGTLPYKLGTFFVTFDTPQLAKGIKIVSTACAITELRLTYLPHDFDGLVASADAVRASVVGGSDIDQWDSATLDAYDESLAAIKRAGKPTAPESLQSACSSLLALIGELKRAQSVSTEELRAAYRRAVTLRGAAVSGEAPLQWPQSAMDAFDEVLSSIEATAGSMAARRGAVLDARQALDDGVFAFQLAQRKPEMSTTLSITGGSLNRLMDGVTASRFQSSGAAADKSKYIDLDYKNETQFESLTFHSWFAASQAVRSIQVQVKTGDQWQDVDGGKIYTIGWTTNSQRPSEARTVTFSSPVKGTALRICIVTTGDNGGIDELEVGIGVNEADMRISLDRDAVTLNEGDSLQLIATVLPAYATNKNVIWTSSDPAAVSVSTDGLVKGIFVPDGVEEKDVIITAATEYGGKEAACTVTLLPKAAEAEDKADAVRRVEILDTLARASKAEDYRAGALDTFRSAITVLQEKLDNPNLTVGGLRLIDEGCAAARKTFDEASLIPLRTVGELIDRVTGAGSKDRFVLEMIPADAVTGMDVYEVDWDAAKSMPVLRGNNAVALATAYNYYLKYFAYLDFPYVGDCDLTLPAVLPQMGERVRIVFPYEYRHYFNENCEYKYTTSLYGEEEWTHRLDWMAMNGFNMFLLDIGEHAVWLNAADELGLNDAAKTELLYANKGTEQYYGEYAISAEAAAREGALAKFVTQRGLDLGMEPEIRPFVGQLLFMFPENRGDYYGSSSKSDFIINLPNSVFDGVTAYAAARWMNLPQGIFLSPEVAPGSGKDADKAKAVFHQVSDIYYASLLEVLGFDEYGRTPQFGFKDMVGEQGFVVQHAAFPQKVIEEMVDGLLKLNPDAVWMQTSWRYSTWLTRYYRPGSLMFVDLKADNNPKWNSTDEFGGTPWVWSMLFNFGGNTGLGGGFDQITTDVIHASKAANYMRGISISPEGGDTNPALYGLMAEMTWRSEAPDMEQWLKDYAKRRYGAENYALAQTELDSVWAQLYTTVYSGNCPGGADGPSQTLINASPKLTGAKARVYGTNSKAYASKDIIPAWAGLLDAADAITEQGGTLNAQFQYDLVDLTRQALGDLSGDVYTKINPAYKADNKDEALKYAGLMVDLCEKMDAILSTNRFFLLGTRLADAKARGVTDGDKAYFEKVERTFMTYWVLDNYDSGKNGGLIDYCNRHLAGLTTDYYGMRWRAFYNELDRAMTAGSGQYSQSNVDGAIKAAVTVWTEDRTPYPTETAGDSAAVSRSVLTHYTPLIQELYLDGGALRALYEANKDRNDDGYPADAWQDFTQALADAGKVLDTALSKEELDAARITLQAALDALDAPAEDVDGVYDAWRQDAATVKPDAADNRALCGTIGDGKAALLLAGSVDNGQNDDDGLRPAPAIFVNDDLNAALSATAQNTVTFDFIPDAVLMAENSNTDHPLPVFGFYMNFAGVNETYFIGYNGSSWNWQRYGAGAGWGNVSGPAIQPGTTYSVKLQWTGTHLDLFQVGVKGGEPTTVMNGTEAGAEMAAGGAGRGFGIRVAYSAWYQSLTSLTISNFRYSGQAREQSVYAVSGKVTYDGAGVANATVTDGTSRAITGSDGSYTLYAVQTGSRDLTVSAPAKGSVTKNVTLTDAGLTDINIALDESSEPAKTYTVTVTGGTGSGEYEEGASVTAAADAPSAGMEFREWTVSGLTGVDLTANPLTFTMPASAVTLTAVYMKTDDQIALEAAKGKVEAGDYTVAQATANTEEAVAVWLEEAVASVLNGTGVSAEIAVTDFHAAVEDDKKANGADGSFAFTVTLTRGERTVTTEPIEGVITMTAYVPPEQTQAPAFALTTATFAGEDASSVAFTLTGDPVETYAVYADAEDGEALDDPLVSVEESTLTLTFAVKPEIETTYYISATDDNAGKAESLRTAVTVKPYEAPAGSEKAVVSFTIPGQAGESVIDEAAHTVTVTMPAGTDLTALTPEITVSAGASVSPASGVEQDFTNGAAYTVTAEDGTSQTYTVSVVLESAPTVPVTGVTLDMTSITLYSNRAGSVKLTADVAPENADNRAVTWSSSDEAVARVDADGTVTAVADGTAVITVTTEDGGLTAACTVTVETYTEPYTPPVSNVTTTTAKNEDGSTTKTSTNRKTGTVTVTTTWPDGAKLVTTTTKDSASTSEVTLPNGRDSVTVTIPTAEKPAPGEVALIVHEDGTREVVRTSVAAENGMRVTLTEGAVLEIADNSKAFADVAEGHWAYDAIQFAASRELFTGTGSGSFNPAGDMTRSMLVTVLARLDGQETSGGAAWYSKATDWGMEAGITDGANMDASITRESLVVMLCRYAKAEAPEESMLHDFPDSEKVSDWAEDAMGWAVANGILTGNGAGELNPAGNASRAEVAAILMRFVGHLVK
ncbi:alpha-N-acetylglucosaminidase C-terminal domain-containing protein [Pseudoflavonifractor phocaeensis]|uniref:alpha-N-acetylglucosaminidase C-terminal domain-containing protein n=1 Tax=Pseudoflavonifractor phocaeensis TaxID=1870988 RepID=UPI002108925E|nr:alpha-N-acetylglucosaminidase C-terminal domain-containing protein [Pseudoflavonifractor phocaeensis]MCQ4863047.1 alpha-N-acetylglucosaminidase C-terminal domain-containing protein [Pseudoflavonifractor phocaeensis]